MCVILKKRNKSAIVYLYLCVSVCIMLYYYCSSSTFICKCVDAFIFSIIFMMMGQGQMFYNFFYVCSFFSFLKCYFCLQNVTISCSCFLFLELLFFIRKQIIIIRIIKRAFLLCFGLLYYETMKKKLNSTNNQLLL